jgi:membrane protease subunit (stomatin/prohibitin family)
MSSRHRIPMAAAFNGGGPASRIAGFVLGMTEAGGLGLTFEQPSRPDRLRAPIAAPRPARQGAWRCVPAAR